MKKIGIYTAFNRDLPFEKRLMLIKSAGFNAVCLNFEKELLPTETTPENQVKLALKHGFSIEAAHLTGSGANTLWSEESNDSLTEIFGEIELMAKLNIKVGVLHVTWGLKPPEKPSKTALKSFKRIAEFAEKQGVKIAFENSVSSQHLRFVLDNIDSKNIGFCYDSGHENAFTKGENFLVDYGNRLLAMHLHDNDGKNDLHLLPFDPKGTINWREKTAQLNSTKLFQNSIILEAESKSEGPEIFLKNAYKSAMKLNCIQ